MRRVLKSAIASAAVAAAIGFATPAFAGVTVAQETGPDLTTRIYASHDAGWADVGPTVYGSTNDSTGHDVVYTGYKTYNFTAGADNSGNTTTIDITTGGGFAQIADHDFVTQGNPNNPIPTQDDLAYLLFDPAPSFYLYEFSIQTLAGGYDINIWYQLVGDSTWYAASGNPIDNGNGDTQYVVGDANDPSLMIDKILIGSGSPIQHVKQNSIQLTGTIPSVPEPASWGLMLLGFTGVGVAMRRSRKRKPVLMQLA